MRLVPGFALLCLNMATKRARRYIPDLHNRGKLRLDIRREGAFEPSKPMGSEEFRTILENFRLTGNVLA